MKIRMRTPHAPWRGGRLRIKWFDRISNGHIRMSFSLTDSRGNETSFEVRDRHILELANLIVDTYETTPIPPRHNKEPA